MFGNYLENVRNKAPLIHNITNYVTINDVANMLFACGARPIMADAPQEAEDITSACSGLNINMGMLNESKLEAMLIAGKCSNKLGHSVLLDPVGIGAGSFRLKAAMKLLDNIKFDVIRGNMSEIKVIASGGRNNSGVDADVKDAVTEENVSKTAEFIMKLAIERECIIAVTGEIDIVSDGKHCCIIRNGRPEMKRITGTGCQLSGMITAFISSNPENKFEAAAAAVCTMGAAGEIGFANMQPNDGNSAYRSRIIDAVYNMTGEVLDREARYDIKS